MLFNSIEFAIFFPVVFLLYWLVFNKSLKLQNIFLLVASYVFYSWWDWKFLLLIAFSTGINYLIASRLGKEENEKKRKYLLYVSLFTSLSLLGFFKYYNFFIQSFIDTFSLFGSQLELRTLNLLLPVGISFYTFQTLSYTIDVYRKKLIPEKRIIPFFACVSFFPMLLAGPIERATHLLPQFNSKRIFNSSQIGDGTRQILWGVFKKLVIADTCAPYVKDIFDNYQTYSASTLLIGIILYSFQIYGDFSGYSDVAIGSSRLLGFDLRRNFAFPNFARDVAEFWRRWHISLNTWFRDYLYIPLGGSKGGTASKVRNTFIIFLVSGFWHGANWTFIAWGFVNACYFLPLLLLKQNRNHLDTVAQGRMLPSLKELFQMCLTFLLVALSRVFFRSDTIEQALLFLKNMCSFTLFSVPEVLPVSVFMLIFFFLVFEWVQREKQHALQIENYSIPLPLRWGLYYVLILMIAWYGGKPQEFIYFKF